MSDVFISYSRRDSDFMTQVHQRLINEGYDVWVDFEDIPPTADWWEEIRSAIEEAHVFAFIISPNSVRSDICRDEIQYAIDNNKRFIPILHQELEDVDAPFVHSAIRSHNWISFLNEDDLDKAYGKLIASFTTDPDYLRRHTRLLVRAREWQNSGRQTSYLLEGTELREFQQWLVSSQDLTPKPTELQYDYILASQTNRTREQLRLAGGLVAGVIIVAILSVFVYFQRQQIVTQNDKGTISAQEQAFIAATSAAQGTQIAAQSTRIADAQENAANIIEEANIQNTQSALQSRIVILEQTVSAFQTGNAVTDTPQATATSTTTATATATLTQTATLPPTWTPTVETADSATVETVGEDDNEVSAQGADPTATTDPSILQTATAQQALYETATREALVSPTPPPTNTPPPTRTLPPTMPPPPPTMVMSTPTPALVTQTITYVVQQGDFAVDIAERFGVSVREIVEANGLSNASLIFAGQQLLIPYELNVATDETLYVASSGADTPDCGTQDRPCMTIAHALDRTENYAEIRLASGVYTEQLTITRNVVITGNGMENTILSGGFVGTILTVSPDVDVLMIGLTITGGNAVYGGAIENYGQITLSNIRIRGNTADLVGGGIANFGTVIADYVDFRGNYAPYFVDVYSAPSAGALADQTMQYTSETSLPERPPEAGDLNIGVLVQVTTTEGDRLNMRPAPGIGSTPAIPLVSGTPLIIIDGPERANNFRWWRVQTVTGQTGWVVDFDDEPTLQVIAMP